MQLISFTANLDQKGDIIIFFVIEEAHAAILDFLHETMRVLQTNNQKFIFIAYNICIKWFSVTV